MNSLGFQILMAIHIFLLPIDVDAAGIIRQASQFRSLDAKPGDEFGTSVAIDGHLAILGAPRVDDRGAAYIFDIRSGTQIAKLVPDDGLPEDLFGTSVAISGNVAIVGSLQADAAGRESGAAYLFDVSSGRQVHKLVGNDTNAEDEFGVSVDIEGNIAIVGAHQAGVGGMAYVFDVNTGSQIRKIAPHDVASDDLFGAAVALDGTTALIGARYDDDLGIAAGSAYLFDITTGHQLHKLHAHDGYWGDRFGMYVDIDGNTAIVASRYDDDAVKSSGSAYLFDVDTGNERFKLVAEDADPNDHFGSSVSVSGNLAILGAVNDDSLGNYTGSAYVFDVTTGKQLDKLYADDADLFDQFGQSVAIDGNRILVGAPQLFFAGTQNPLPSGKAYGFEVVVPEPSSLILASLGLLSIAALWKTRPQHQ
jgi:WD40 repeat protein